MADQVTEDTPILPDDGQSRAKELHAAMHALEAKNADVVIGNDTLTLTVFVTNV